MRTTGLGNGIAIPLGKLPGLTLRGADGADALYAVLTGGTGSARP